MLPMEGMMRLASRSRFQRVDPFTRVLVALLAAALAFSVPATLTAEALLCVHHLEHGSGEHGSGAGGADPAGGAPGSAPEPAHGAAQGPGPGTQQEHPGPGHPGHGFTGDAGEDARPHGQHGGDPGDSHPPGHACVCPHPCGPGATVGGVPSVGILVILSHPPVAPAPAWDILPLPLFDPRGVPTGPDPPTPSFIR
jgi:hypothetical protein